MDKRKGEKVMANRNPKTDHLPKFKKGENTIQKLGAKAAAISHKQAKTAREKVKMWMGLVYKGVDVEKLKEMGIEQPTLYDKMLYDAIVSAAKSKNAKDKREALKIVTDISGEAPNKSETQVDTGINIIVQSKEDAKKIDDV